MRRLSEEMDRMFASAFGHFRDSSESGAWTPAIEVREHDEGVIIEGERRQEHEETRHAGRSAATATFAGMIPLPQGAETDKGKDRVQGWLATGSRASPRGQAAAPSNSNCVVDSVARRPATPATYPAGVPAAKNST